MSRQQKLSDYKTYNYTGTFSYSEGQAFLDVNLPWMMCYIKYEGDATIIPNTKDIILGARIYKNRVFFTLLAEANPKVHLFTYFGTLIVKKVKVFSLAAVGSYIPIVSPNNDYPEIIGTSPEDFTRFPEEVKKAYTYHTKKTLRIIEATKRTKGLTRRAKTGKGKGKGKASDIGGGGSTY